MKWGRSSQLFDAPRLRFDDLGLLFDAPGFNSRKGKLGGGLGRREGGETHSFFSRSVWRGGRDKSLLGASNRRRFDEMSHQSLPSSLLVPSNRRRFDDM